MQENLNHKLLFAPRSLKGLWLETEMDFATYDIGFHLAIP